MPALNITFTEEELARLRRQARAEGVSMTSLVHGLAVGASERAEHNEAVLTASTRVIGLSQELLRRLADG